MSLSKSVNLTHAQTPVPCDACDNEVPGEYYCKECKQTLCPLCEKYHRKFTKDHNVVHRSQVADIDTMTLSCVDHDEQATVHCEPCNIQVCIKCVTGKHQGHKMVDFAEVFEQKRKLLQNHVDEIQELLPKFERKTKDIELEKENYEKKVLQITKDMEAENKSLHEEIDRIHDERLKRLNIIRQSHLLMFDGCTIEMRKKKELLQKRKSEYWDVIGKNSVPVLVKFVPKLEPLPEIGSTPTLPVPPSFVPGNIKKIAENLGELQLSDHSLVVQPLRQTTPTIISKFKSPLEGNPSIFITKEGDVWLGGQESTALVMVDITGQILRQRRVYTRPHALAVMDCGDLILSPSPKVPSFVIKILADGKNTKIFEGSSSSSLGVSVTADQQILICMGDGKVMRTYSDGTNVTQLYRGVSAIYAVEIFDGNICISDRKTPAIVIVSKNGETLSTIKQTTEGQTLGTPLGFAVDKMGNIICADNDNHCIYIMDRNLQLTELVGLTHGIQQPRQLAVDNDNNLWITQYDRSVIVVKYLA